MVLKSLPYIMYFYDDSKENIRSVKSRKDIKSIWVSNKRPLSKNKSAYLSMFQQKYPNNRYAKLIDESVLNTLTLGSGLTIDEIRHITYKRAKLVIFDWDLTLSVFNGTYAPGNNFIFPKDIPMNDIALFYAGSNRRLEAIKLMFSTLREKGTRIYILTDNGWGERPNEFVKLLNCYDPRLKPREILYGNRNKLKKINQVFTRKRLNSFT